MRHIVREYVSEARDIFDKTHWLKTFVFRDSANMDEKTGVAFALDLFFEVGFA